MSSSLRLSCLQQSGEDEAADNTTETEARSPAETEPRLITEDNAASPKLTPEPEPQEIQAASNACRPPEGAAEANGANSKAHLFIFDSESQEEGGSQAAAGDGLSPVLANVHPTVNTISTFLLTQAQLEEDKRQITKLMNETKQVMMPPL